MGAYWDQVAQRPSLLQIFQAAGITKAQRDARAQDEATQQRQAEQQTYERDRQTRIDKMSLDQMNRQQQRQDKNDQAKLDAAKQTTDANKSRYAAQIVASDPSKAQTMAEWLRGQGIESEQANVSLPGGEQIQAQAVGDIAPSQDAGQFATDLEGQAAGVLGVQKPAANKGPELDPAAKAVILGKGLHPSDAGWQEAYAAERDAQSQRRIAERKAGAMNLNLGEKPLPANEAGDYGDAEASKRAIDELTAAYIKDVPHGGLIDQTAARVSSEIPNTPTNIFKNNRMAVTQIYGRYLEGGVLKEPEVKRYGSALAGPGDSAETALKKAEIAKRMIDLKTEERRRAQGGAGYRTPPAIGAKRQDHGGGDVRSMLNQRIADKIAQGMPLDQAKAEVIQQYKQENGVQ